MIKINLIDIKNDLKRHSVSILLSVPIFRVEKIYGHPKADEDTRRTFQEKIACYRKQGRSLVYLDLYKLSPHQYNQKKS